MLVYVSDLCPWPFYYLALWFVQLDLQCPWRLVVYRTRNIFFVGLGSCCCLICTIPPGPALWEWRIAVSLVARHLRIKARVQYIRETSRHMRLSNHAEIAIIFAEYHRIVLFVSCLVIQSSTNTNCCFQIKEPLRGQARILITYAGFQSEQKKMIFVKGHLRERWRWRINTWA